MFQNDSDRFHSRKNPRMSHYDYTTPNYYFVTICTRDKICLFGTVDRLNEFGKIANTGLSQIENHFPGVRMDKYIVMPNHIHAIVVLTNTAVDLSVVIGQYKSFVSNRIHKAGYPNPVWQTSFHDHVIRSQRSYQHIWQYIDSNHAKWQTDCFYTED